MRSQYKPDTSHCNMQARRDAYRDRAIAMMNMTVVHPGDFGQRVTWDTYLKQFEGDFAERLQQAGENFRRAREGCTDVKIAKAELKHVLRQSCGHSVLRDEQDVTRAVDALDRALLYYYPAPSRSR